MNIVRIKFVNEGATEFSINCFFFLLCREAKMSIDVSVCIPKRNDSVEILRL